MLKNYLNESLTSKIYRITHLDRFVHVLRDNKFYTSLAFGAETDESVNKGRIYYLSFMRTRNNQFASERYGWPDCVRMTLDGNKFNHNFKSVPVDYWQEGPKMSESEDRVITDKPYINNAMSYMQSVDIYVSLDSHDECRDMLLEVIDILVKNNIKFYVYNDESAFVSSNIRKAINIKNGKYKKIMYGCAEAKHRIQMYIALFNYVLNDDGEEYFFDLKTDDSGFIYMLDEFKTEPEKFIEGLQLELEEEFANPAYRRLFHELFSILKKAGVVKMGDLSRKISEIDPDNL